MFAAYASAENPSATDGRHSAGDSLTDESFLIHPTDEPYSPVRSATAADRIASEDWHPAIWEHACMVSDAFPSMAPCIAAISSPGCSLPPSAHSFPPPPHKRDDNHTRFTNILSVSYCLGVFVALPFNLRRAPNGVASWLSSHTSGWHDTT